LGALLGIALRRPGTSTPVALMLAALAAAVLSYGCEVLQQFVPRRVPALEDLGMNTGGALLGALLGMATQALGWVRRWQRMRERWFGGEGAFALALLGLWPLGSAVSGASAAGSGSGRRATARMDGRIAARCALGRDRIRAAGRRPGRPWRLCGRWPKC
jgi:hypothetical protein